MVTTVPRTLSIALLALALAACEAAAPVVEGGSASSGPAGAKADKGTLDITFIDVSDDRPMDAAARAIMEQALTRLAEVAAGGDTELQRLLAHETLARISDGDVLLGAVLGASGVDLWHMCRDLERDDCGDPATGPADDDLDDILAALADDLDGYQWGNRLYFTLGPDTDIQELAGTLVHEVNHVLNRSECSYYEDFLAHTVDQDLAFLEEYRAFFVECYFTRGADADLEGCDEYANTTLEERGYDLTPDLTQLVQDGPATTMTIAETLMDWWVSEYGAMVPIASAWPDDFEPCDPMTRL